MNREYKFAGTLGFNTRCIHNSTIYDNRNGLNYQPFRCLALISTWTYDVCFVDMAGFHTKKWGNADNEGCEIACWIEVIDVKPAVDYGLWRHQVQPKAPSK